MSGSVLCTFPGKFGDLLWALPTLRAIHRRGWEVDLFIPESLGAISELLRGQEYLRHVYVDPTWAVANTAPASPRVPDRLPDSDHRIILHLGYRDWPTRELAQETLDCANAQGWGVTFGSNWPLQDHELDLTTPWIKAPGDGGGPGYYWPWAWLHGFTDEHFELKYGLVHLLLQKPQGWWKRPGVLPPTTIGSNARWELEGGYFPTTWLDSARMLAHAQALLACNSALHVLAVAMGVPVVMMEPNPHRHHWIFYPVGDKGPQVYLVRGNDGQPTFDARHVRDALDKVLAARLSTGVDSPTPHER